MAGPIRQGPHTVDPWREETALPLKAADGQRVSLRIGRQRPRGGASSSGAAATGLRGWFGSPAPTGTRPCPPPTLPSPAARSSHQRGCHGALTTQGVPKLLHDPGTVAQGCCQTGGQEKRVPRPKGDTRNTGDLSEPRLCAGAACPHEGLGRRAAPQTQLSRPGPPGARALGPPVRKLPDARALPRSRTKSRQSSPAPVLAHGPQTALAPLFSGGAGAAEGKLMHVAGRTLLLPAGSPG